MTIKDYYKILQVDPEAEPEVIHKAFRWLAKKYHPDRDSSPAATERMKELNVAYDVLKDPAARAEYDRARPTDRRPGGAGSSSSGSGSSSLDRPQLGITPAEVALDDVDPGQALVTVRIVVNQVGGPPFDPRIHKLYLNLRPPWDVARFARWHTDADRPPMAIEFDLDVTDLELKASQVYSGEIELVVRIEM